MKQLLLLIILTVNLNVNCQNKDIEILETQEIAIISENRDTLYVIDIMYKTLLGAWDDPKYNKDMPVIISVNSLKAYRRKY